MNGPREEEKEQGDVTNLLQRWNDGDPEALDMVVTLVYRDLKKAGRYYLKTGRDASMSPTILVHGVYERLADGEPCNFQNRDHFFNTARMIMRQLLVQQARKRGAEKRGGDLEINKTLDEGFQSGKLPVDADLMDEINECLDRLKEMDPRKHQMIELRFFVGLNMDEIAEIVGVSERTIRREWQTARSWLARELKKSRKQG